VYDNPTIYSMASFLGTLVAGDAGTGGQLQNVVASKVAVMRAMVNKYTSDYPAYLRAPSANGVQGAQNEGDHVVLLTGSTGALGCYVLASLVDDPSIARVYAVNRPSRSSVPLSERQANALVERGLDSDSILGSEKVRLIEADVSATGFGIERDAYEEVSRLILRDHD